MSEIQAYNGMLQSAPGILFTLFAGPLSDQIGRKPLILSALFGYLLLDVIFLFNAVWFFELKVEYLLLECLQDLTGGATCFYLAAYSYMSDITDPATRTRRLSLLDCFMPIGFCIGLPLGTWIRNNHGFVALYTTAGSMILVAMLYVAFSLKESVSRHPKDKGDDIIVKPDKGNIFRRIILNGNIEFRRLLQKLYPIVHIWLPNHVQATAGWSEEVDPVLHGGVLHEQGDRLRGRQRDLHVLQDPVRGHKLRHGQPVHCIHLAHVLLPGELMTADIHSNDNNNIFTKHSRLPWSPS